MASHRDKMDHDLRFGDPADWSEEKANKEEFEEDGFGEGVKYDAGKPSIARLPSRAVFEIARVFKHGADKYDDTNRLDDNNWRHGMRWSRLHDAALRHIFAHKQGEDLDQDSGLNHLAHAACSLMMLLEFHDIYPQGDDRDHLWQRGREYVLDIDGVIANFLDPFYAKAKEIGVVGSDLDPKRHHTHWSFPFEDGEVWDAIDTEEWYLREVPALLDGTELPVDPLAYLTHRPCRTETTVRWLEEHNFPMAPVHTVDEGDGKVGAANEIVERSPKPVTFVEDRFENFRALNEAGHHCLLLDRPWNRHFDVGRYRISTLDELTQDEAYEQV